MITAASAPPPLSTTASAANCEPAAKTSSDSSTDEPGRLPAGHRDSAEGDTDHEVSQAEECDIALSGSAPVLSTWRTHVQMLNGTP